MSRVPSIADWQDVGEGRLLHLADSWYMGINIAAKPRALLS